MQESAFLIVQDCIHITPRNNFGAVFRQEPKMAQATLNVLSETTTVKTTMKWLVIVIGPSGVQFSE